MESALKAIAQPHRRQILRLVRERRNGTRRLYRTRPKGLVELRTFLEQFWSARLEQLEAEREEHEQHG